MHGVIESTVDDDWGQEEGGAGHRHSGMKSLGFSSYTLRADITLWAGRRAVVKHGQALETNSRACLVAHAGVGRHYFPRALVV